MPDALDMQASKERAKKVDADLLSTDDRFTHWVTVTHEEGAHFVLPSSFVMDDPEDKNFLWVFCEHQQLQVFAKDELLLVAEFSNCEYRMTAHGWASR